MTTTLNPLCVLIPDGMSKADAQQALTDARPWVPLPNGPTEAHVNKRLRVVWKDGQSSVQDRVARFRGGMVEWAGGAGDNWHNGSGDWFVHPDDVPSDPDADLIYDLAHALARSWMETTVWGSPPNVPDPVWANLARVAIERVRAGVSA